MNKDISFEKALSRLEELVGLMESDSTPLEKLLSFYEEGVALSRFCQSVLSETEKKIQALTEKVAEPDAVTDNDGELPF
ncbi:MAG TPA: exodeoxyribonuclease VII small subunit [Candidatus Marinimicrobia bacterium]|nr:exodeoxyribonuclease VII small subunit [Candidatus Neomarinimicrobiota bacterium]